MIQHRGIVSYEPTSWWWLLMPGVVGAGAVSLWFAGRKAEALAGGGTALLSLIMFPLADRLTIQRAEREAEPFQRHGFLPIEDPNEREMLLVAARKNNKDGGGYVVLLHGLRDDLEVVVTIQSADAHATNREIGRVPTITLEARVAASPTPFRIGPQLAICFRPIERGLQAPPSGFANKSLERKWFMYIGAAATAEGLLPREILHEPWREERWSGGGGLLRVSWHGGLTDGHSVEEALARFVRAVRHVNAAARGAGAVPKNGRPRELR